MIDNQITRRLSGYLTARIAKRLRGRLFGRGVGVMLAALLLTCVVGVASAQAATYYIAPGGNDTAAGTSTATPWKTFARAWQTVRAGDTLLVMDGTYNQSIEPTVSGTAAAPITIKALNDGKATVDGQGVRRPVALGSNNQAVGDWFVIEGLVLRNGTDAVLHVRADNNVLRRVSVYDADTDVNSQPLLLWGSNNTVEDCLVGGTGRFMVDVYGGGEVTANGNTVRRCFVKWSGWDGKNFCGVTWPNGFMMGAYNSSGGTFENNVIYGKGVMGLIVQANTSSAQASNNHVLGNLTLLQGKDYNGSLWNYGSYPNRPGPTDDPYDTTNCDDAVTPWTWPGQRVGLKFFGQGVLQNNVFRDNLSANNAGLGFSYANPGGGRYSGNVIDHLTIYGNGADAPADDGGPGTQAVFPPGVACTNCRIGSATTGDGSGARLGYRYVNRTLTNQPLLPWPMESRAVSELGVSINAIVSSAIEQGGGVVEPIATPTPVPATATPVVAPSPTPAPTSTPAPNVLSIAVSSNPQIVRRGGVVTIKVAVNAPSAVGKPVHITVTDSARAGMQISPTETTINAPGEATFKAQFTSSQQGDLHVLTFKAQAAGMTAAEQSVTILVNPTPLFLPAIMAGQ